MNFVKCCLFGARFYYAAHHPFIHSLETLPADSTRNFSSQSGEIKNNPRGKWISAHNLERQGEYPVFRGGLKLEYDRNKWEMSPTYLILFTSSAQLLTLLSPQLDCYLLEGIWTLNTVLHVTQEEVKWITSKINV